MEKEAQKDQGMSSLESACSEVLESGDYLTGPISYDQYMELQRNSGSEPHRYILQTSSGSSSSDCDKEEATSLAARNLDGMKVKEQQPA